jgi:methanogenic corrinoid protein MtbC1
VTEGVNPPNEEFFDAVARLEADLVQFSKALGQRD